MINLFFKVSPESSHAESLAVTLLRVGAGLYMAIGHGLGKLPPPDMLVQGVAGLGFPFATFFAWMAGLSEFAGGLLVAIGLLTRPAAIFLSITMAVAAFGVHFADPFNVKEMAILYLLIFIVFAVKGSGRWSIDFLIKKKV